MQSNSSMFHLLVVSLLLSGCSGAADAAEFEAIAGEHVIVLEIAATPEERARGLMYRETLPTNSGMLFIFPDDREVSFWMKNTSIPLSIAYLRRDGVILGIYDMKPFSLDPVPSGRPVRYALEVNQGWFHEHGITVGDRIQLPRELPPAR